MGTIIIAEASLSFLGIGVQSSVPTWGGMLADGREFMRQSWWMATFPGIAISIVVLSINLFGDGLRDALDPQLQKKMRRFQIKPDSRHGAISRGKQFMSVQGELIQKKEEIVTRKGMVVAESVEAADAGLEIFEKGGNAVDVAVATAFASCTCEPAMASLGGGGAALIYLAEEDRTVAIEFEGRLSKSATEEMFVDDLLPLGVDPHPSFGWRGTRNNVGWMGYRSLGVPGQVAGLCEILERFGSMSLEEVIAPAVRICEEGYEINKYYALMIGSNMKLLEQYPPINELLVPGGHPPIPASQYDKPTIIVQKELAETLRKIAQGGAAAFYRGDIVKDIIADTVPHGSIVTLQDYADYQPKWYDEGLTGSYRGYELVCMPEVFGGIQVLQTLNLLEGFDLPSLQHNSAHYLHLLAECFRRTWVDRFRYMGDPEFEEVPIQGLVSKAYADEMRQFLNLERAPDEIKPGNPWRFQGGWPNAGRGPALGP